jgi:hypothetical protein
MRILFVSATPHNGLQERWAQVVRENSPHEARVLAPSTWRDRQAFTAARKRDGEVYSILDRSTVDEQLEWADAVQFIYGSSLAALGRRDLLGKKRLSWYLALRWKPEFLKLFPGEDRRHYRFLLACEGWTRYQIPREFRFRLVPFLIPIHDQLLTPLPWERRSPDIITCSPRAMPHTAAEDFGCSAPRNFADVRRTLKLFRLRVIYHRPWEECLREKAESALALDDLVNPLFHGSGYEYLSLGVPLLNRVDERLRTEFGECYGSFPPLLTSDLVGVRRDAGAFFRKGEEWRRGRAEATRAWAVENLDPARTVGRYLEQLQ